MIPPSQPASLPESIAALPKAELHLHLEGSIQIPTVCALTARHGSPASADEVRARYAYSNFPQFIEAFKWVTSFLREPRDYALIARDLAEHLLTQNVVYAEVTLSVGVMLLRGQRPEANFEAILAAVAPFEKRGLRMNFIFDAVRQFGADAARAVVESARQIRSPRIVAFGIGGDELSISTSEFRRVYGSAAEAGLHLLIHAGEIGGPDMIRESVELLGAQRIGHGIAAVRDRSLMDLLAEKRIPLEVCPTSNIRTGALDRQLGRAAASIEDHPLPALFRHGIPVVLSTDDPPMFHTTLRAEYELALQMGLAADELRRLVKMSFDHSFLSPQEKLALQG